MARKLIGVTDLYYEIFGSGMPAVLLHGWGMDQKIMSGCLEPVFREFGDAFMRIYIDLPGMGRSKAGGDIHNSDDMLRVLLSFLDEVIPGQEFILAGESYGGLLARGIVKARQRQVKGLLLICPAMKAGFRRGTVEPLRVVKRDEEFLGELSEEERQSFCYMNVCLTRNVWERYKADIYGAILEQDRHFLGEVLDGAFTYDVDDLSEPFDAPALIITGRIDTEVGCKDQFELMKKYPKCTYIAIADGGHNVQIEQPEIFAAAVSGWIKANFI